MRIEDCLRVFRVFSCICAIVRVQSEYPTHGTGSWPPLNSQFTIFVIRSSTLYPRIPHTGSPMSGADHYRGVTFTSLDCSPSGEPVSYTYIA